jgi:hypothetical protein
MTIQIRKAIRTLILAGFVILVGGFMQPQEEVEKKEYPKPRFPSYLKQPQSAEEVMRSVRGLVRNKASFQGYGMGVVGGGETALLVPTSDAEDVVVEGIRLALEERGVKVIVLPDYEVVGVSRQEAMDLKKATRTYTAEKGFMEAAGWIERVFPDAEATKQWLKGRRPDLYEKIFPKERELPAHLVEIRSKLGRRNVGQGLQKFLENHPEVKAVFWAKGGTTGARRALYPFDEKYGGVFTSDNRWEAMSRVGSYPADVWQLSEEATLESLAYVDRVEVTDPEGTDVWADVSQIQAEKWARGGYQRGHLYMFPNQATGRFGYSVVTYPAFQKEWLPREPIVRLNGVIAGTNGHGGFFPRWEVYLEDGFISGVKGGGLYGELLREFLQYPQVNELTYPFHDNPGFWYVYEIAFGTNPKYFRNPKVMMEGSLGPERMVSGVIHWGLGIRVWHDPEAPTESQRWREFTAKHNLPADHNFHTHTYFSNYRVHLRAADRWLTLLDRGHMSSLGNPEVRALASRYGDPDEILAQEWIPEVPGINAPGKYEDYAANPWKYAKGVIDKVTAGSYEHFYPPVQTGGNGK